jgi:hypothetical protein
MRAFVIHGTLLVAAALVTGCGERNAPTAASQALPGSVVDSTSGPSQPAEPGFFLIRFQSRFGFYAIDFERQLIAFHSTDSGDQLCGEPFTVIDLANRQGLFNPADESLIMDLLLADEHYVKVYDATGLAGDIGDAIVDCTYLNLPLLAGGTARFQLTDNDFLAFLRDEPIRANAAGFTAEGTLNLAGGGLAHYNATQKVIFLPPDNLPGLALKINLTPDPR